MQPADTIAPEATAPRVTEIRRPHPARRVLRVLAPIPWVGPAAALIAVVVIWPVVAMVQTSFQHISHFGLVLGSNGNKNYRDLFNEPNLSGVMTRTLVWVVAVCGSTMLLSLGLAQLFNQRFPGRRIARWALIAPWAASVMMTSIIFRWMLDPNTGAINLFLHQIGVLHKLGTDQADWLGRPTSAMVWMIAVAVFVSLPFTSYTILAGLQTIPADVYEAARVDGASRLRTYWSITLPLLRPSIIVAALINMMNVFNSFPIIWEMTRGGPGYATNTSTIFMYNLKEGGYIGESASLSVINFGVVILIVLVFLKVSNWRGQGD